MEVPVNYWAVVVAATAAMAVGALWYGPVFGKQWRALMGISLEEMKAMPLSPMQAMAGGFVVALIMAYVLSHVIAFASSYYAQPSSYMAGLSAAFWMWLGFVATTQVGVVLWEGKRWQLFFLNTTYSLVSMLVMGAILGVWPPVA
jgi:hypothetical protein